ncbi:MAG: hypothetical protein COZ06_00240 [Armatimonadetes bacterium CG_4_10_14_3_um_filter_66_18]|nr:glycosyltransferase family 4 protein [Armatimonadota bacterium]PIU89418.1 MAG: hypothetical protein COS65_28370 [Armatimonadetes bacterium CG06_land_8_20_14_3_00_66_21]PIX47681.1 MAG: hypothetical protein COZ57_07770 [Armatimonadetes bacterium CG_4_8_14_3_um_filter_66_20]PIY54283.1 MAG: hypothetical protein COZ06_00240 [Armatimonadetes bacterium CG_4_10_14_3_um_filter_66_18]PIZ30783.1 MAG: hypothetical protein COY42_33510 [Armatimonadetes bacterium CG_4_10_14_0_8_um_filter_66_14]PJB64184.1 
MTLAILTPGVFRSGLVVGGGERYAFELARALSKRLDTRLIVAGSRRQRLRVGQLTVETHFGRGGIRGDETNPWSPEFLRDALRCDLLHCIGYHKLLVDFSILCGRLAGRSVYCTDVGGGGTCLSTYAGRVGLPGTGRFSNGHLALSQFAADYSRDHFRRASVVYGGVDTSLYQPGSGSQERRVAFVGRLLPHKGVDRLIRCLPADVPLTVAGRPHDPAYFALLQRLARGKAVTFLLEADDRAILRLYQTASVVVLPSVHTDCSGRHHAVPELLGLALIEAMACGTPVVCTAVGGMPEVVQHEVTGLVVPENDEPALCEAVLRLLEAPDLAARLGRRARLRVLEQFTWDRTAERCLAAYRELG